MAVSWNGYPPVVGFFAVVFRQHPDWIDKLTPDHVDARAAEGLAAVLQLAGQSAQAQIIRPRLMEAGSDVAMKAELAGLPLRLEDIRIATPTHLDILWGASFASGDARYARMIADFFARTANCSEAIALDIARTVAAMMGGPREILAQLKDKHGEPLAREIIFAASAM